MALRAHPEFQAKFDQLLNVIDSRTQRPVTETLGATAGNLEINSSTGGGVLKFYEGAFYQFDNTHRIPIVALWGKIKEFHDELGGTDGGFGRPLTDVVDLSDGGRCAIFEGGHIHEYRDMAQPFPASQCVAPFKPDPPPFPFGIGPAGLPIAFHQKWMSCSLTKSPEGPSIAEALQTPYARLTENGNGGQCYNFWGGSIVTTDGSSPPIVSYGKIHERWNDPLGGVKGGMGRPLADPQDLGGGGICQVFEGGHIHKYGEKVITTPAERCPATYKPTPRVASWNDMPPHFQHKWSALCGVEHPLSRETVAEMLSTPYGGLTDNPNNVGGERYGFWQGCLMSLSKVPSSGGLPLELTQPFAVYGPIFAFWQEAGEATSTYGRPLCDEQNLPDGGRCSIFEGGHIHMYNGQARGVPANQCTASIQPSQYNTTVPAVTTPPVHAPQPHPQMSYSQSPPPAPLVQNYQPTPPPSQQYQFTPPPQQQYHSTPPPPQQYHSAPPPPQQYQSTHPPPQQYQPTPQPQTYGSQQQQQGGANAEKPWLIACLAGICCFCCAEACF